MPLRPTTKNQENRPISAIYIGKGNLNNSVSSTATTTTTTSTTLTQPPPLPAPAYIAHYRKSSSSSVPPGLPDLPEPPSPVLSNSSAGSGLPSPPATNSTGSGSTGDTRRIAMKNGAYDLLDGDVADDLMDEDTTARMRLAGASAIGRHAVAAASTENVAALARVRNLAERNRQALDKLSSMARLASPSPSSVSTRHSRTSSTALSVHSSSSSQSTSSRPSRPRTSHLPSVTPSSASQEQVLSGSETEKESTSSLYAYYPNNSSPSLHEYASYPLSAVSSSSSSSIPHSLPQTNGYDTSHTHTPTNGPSVPITHQTMQQQQSQPCSKHNRIASLVSASTSHLPPGPRVFQTPPSQQLSRTRSTGTNTPGGSLGGTASTNRMQQASVPSSVGYVNSNVEKPKEGGSTSSNSPRRRRPGSTNMQSTILPLTEEETEPMKLRRRSTVKAEDKDVTQAALAAVASSRSQTSLDTRRRGTLPKGFRHEVLVEDNYGPHDPITPYQSKGTASRDLTSATSLVRENKPSLRGGSAESALTTRGPTGAGLGGRSVVSEVLKAVGLSPRRNRRLERERDTKRETQGDFVVDGDVFRDQKEDYSPEVAKLPISEFGERRNRVRERERERMEHLGSRSATSLSLRRYASRSQSRARTGIGEFSDEENSDDGGGLQDDVTRTAPAGLRAHRHTYSTPRDVEREVAHLSLMKKEKEREREREKERAVVSGRSMTSLSKYSTPVHQTLTGPSSTLKYSSHASSYDQERERAVSRQSALASIERTEHVRLMMNSLAMFEGHVSRISSSADGGSFNQAHISELVRTAESVVTSADRLNGALRASSKHAVEQEIDAEVADDVEVSENGGRGGTYSARDTAKMWRAVSAEYKEGVKASDELVRGITTFLLGIGKFLRDVDTLEGAGDRHQASENGGGSIANSHARSVSLNDEDIIRSARGISPALSGGSSGRDASRRSVDVARKGWEPSPLGVHAREEALRRLTERSDDAPSVRTSSSVLSRERDQDVRYESPVSHSFSRHNPAFMTPASSRSSTALSNRWSHREQEPQHRSSRLPPSESEDILASTSQDTITPYEPSPSPAPRIRDASDRARKNLPPLRTSRPLPSIPSESSLRQQDSPSDNDQASVSEHINKMHERRKASQTSISTIRGALAPVSSPYPAALNPSGGGATTAVTTHTVSNTSPEETPVSASILSSESRRHLRSNITFSKPSTESAPTLAVLQQQYEERQRITATSLGSVPSTPMSGSETERPPKRRTWGVRTGLKGKAELESFGGGSDRVLGRAADRSAAATSSVPKHLHSLNSARIERRAVTELFPAS